MNEPGAVTTGECVDLREVARARRWRWRFEESYQAERDAAARSDGRWYVELVCRRGLIYPAGADVLAAFTNRRGVLGELLGIGPEVRVHQRGDREAIVRFPIALLDAVARVLKPKRYGGRPATEEDRTRLARTAFRPALPPPESGPGTTIPMVDGSQALPPASDASTAHSRAL